MKNKKFPLLAALAALTLTCNQSAQATTYYWNTNTTGAWTDGANWSDVTGTITGTAPINDTTTDSVVFNQSSFNSGDTTAQMTTATSIAGITFDNTSLTKVNSDLLGNRTLTLGAGGITIASGAGAVTFGTATDLNRISLVLSASQTWLNNSSNVLALTTRNSINLGTNTLTFGGSGDFSQNAAGTNARITGTGSIIKTGAGTLTLSQINLFSGTTTISGGTLVYAQEQVLQQSSLNTTGSIDGDASNGLKTTVTSLRFGGLTGNKDLASLFTTASGGYETVTVLTLGQNGGTTNSYSGVIADGATGMNLVKVADGTQILSGINTYTGTTTVTAGILTTPNAAALSGYNSADKVVFNGGIVGVQVAGSGWTTGEVDTLLSNATKTSGSLGIDTTNGDFTYGSDFNVPIGLTKLGTNALTLSGNNSHTGNTTLSAGTLNINSTTALGATASTFVIGNGTTIDATAGAITLTNNNPVTFAGNVNGNYFTFGGTNDLNLGTGAILLQLPTTTNPSTGVIQLNGSGRTLTFGGAATSPARGSNTIMQVNGAGNTLVFGSLRLNESVSPRTNTWSGTANVTVNGGVLDNPTGGQRFAYSGSGIFTIGGASTYTGNTTINSGTLALGASGSITTSPVINIGAGAVLDTTAKTSFALGTRTFNFTVTGAGAGSSGRINATGKELDISNAVLNFNVGAALDDAVYILADYGTLVGTVGSATPPAGYKVEYDHNGGTQIALVPLGSDYDTWAAIYSPANLTNMADDNDKDGLTNLQEWAYGLSPVNGSSVNPILVQLDKSAGTFTYQRRSSTGLAYTILTSPDLVTWTPNVPTSAMATPSGSNESVAVTLSGLPLPEKLFVRVAAQ